MDIFFIIIAAILLASGVNVVAQKGPINSAISLIVNLLCMAIMYFLLGSNLVGATQIIIYAGAVVVLFLFAIMIIGSKHISEKIKILMIAVPLLFVCLVGLTIALRDAGIGPTPINLDIKVISKTLFTNYLLPFELISVLFLIGLVGVVVLAKKND